jgi:hypothetical protein
LVEPRAVAPYLLWESRFTCRLNQPNYPQLRSLTDNTPYDRVVRPGLVGAVPVFRRLR